MPDSSNSFLDLLKEFFQKLIELLFSKAKTGPHYYVEMGDGLKWSTCNLGASKPEEFGDYIAWGEVETYYSTLNPLTWKPGKEAGYDFKTNRYLRKKYTVEDGKAVLEKLDDAAFVNWKGSWRMPTLQEWERLLDKDDFTWEFTTREGVQGYTVTSKIKGYEGNRIFLPAARCIVYSNWVTDPTMGCYWSSSVFPENERYESSDLYAKCLRFEGEHLETSHGGRGDGFSIRPVSD